MNIAVLSSSRADYSIYLPLLKKISADTYFNLKIIAFGTHLSHMHGYTVSNFAKDNLNVTYTIESLVLGDSPEAISTAIGLTTMKFSSVWEKEKETLDLVICLGDRYEMFAAVSSIIPFLIPIAHIHGGETTLGAIDNVFRHSITCMAKYHFASTEKHRQRISEIKGNSDHVYNVGALSIDNIKDIQLMDKKTFYQECGIELNCPVLVTFHPETAAIDKNSYYVDQLIEALKEIKGQIIITMPNADTMGSIIRKKLMAFSEKNKNSYIVESLGVLGYFTCLSHCTFVLGNSSSGIIEAASFGKYVINIGDRQKGRDVGSNVIQCAINKQEILKAIESISSLPTLSEKNIYGDGNTADKIISTLKSI